MLSLLGVEAPSQSFPEPGDGRLPCEPEFILADLGAQGGYTLIGHWPMSGPACKKKKNATMINKGPVAS